MRFLGKAPRQLAAVPALAVLAVLYTQLSAQSVINSDGANEALQGLAMWQGNLLLRGWWLAQDTFYFTDAALYGLLARLQGLGPAVVHEGAGLVYAAAVVVAALLVGRGALIAAAALAIPPPLLLQGQMHILGVVYVLAALLLIERFPGSRWTRLSAGALTVAAMVSDPFLVLLFAPAIAIAGAVRRDRRRALLLPAVLGTAASVLFPRLVGALGGFTEPRALAVGLAAPPELVRNASLLVRSLLLVLHADVIDAPGDPLAWLRLPAVACVGAGVVLAARRWRSRAAEDLVPQILLLACAADLASFLFTTQPVNLDSARFLSPLAVCGAALGGRELAPLLGGGRLRAAALAGAVATVAALPLAFSRPAAHAPTAGLERWLLARGLTRGAGSYWEAAIVTLDTHGRVTIRCVDGPAAAGDRASPDRWFQDSRRFAPDPRAPADFVVFSPGEHSANIDETGAVRAFGPPSEIHRVGAYEVLVYPGDLLARLSG